MPPAPDPTLTPFFNPRGIVVVGASTNPAKLGFGIAQNLVKCGYGGAVHFANPKGGRLFERPIYAEIATVPDPVDLAVILVPPAAVPPTLQACARRGIRAAIVASGGFRETGPEGAALEEACLAIAQEHEMRLLGPNCIGLMDTHLPLDTTFLPPPAPPAGDIAFISHSGAICAAIVDWSRGQGFGFSRLVSLGNQADVTETDVLSAVAADPHTRVIALYLESVSDGRRFVEIARQITPHKPIVALKVGRTQAGKQAAVSHTGALAGREAAFDAALRRAGILRAQTAEEMFDWAQALAASANLGFGNAHWGVRIGVLTNAGGPGVMAADALEMNGLRLAALSEETREGLRALLAPAASVVNPVDMLASASPDQYAGGLRLLLEDGGVDAVLVILPPPPMYAAGAVARALIPLIQTSEKLVVVSLMGHGLVQEALAFLRAAGVPTYAFPEKAVGALGAVNRQQLAVNRERLTTVNSKQSTVSGQRSMGSGLRAAESISSALSASSAVQTPWIPQALLFSILRAYGIDVPDFKVVTSAAEAAAAAEEIGFPVALKIAAGEMTHKSDFGGVRLDVQDEEEAAAVFEALARLTEEPRILVQQMIPRGQELIAGVTRDAQFGPLLMVGSGGVEVEGLGDVAFALAPLSEGEARHLLAETWAGRKLAGYRDIPPADVQTAVDVIVRLGQIAVDFPQLAEIEINPLIVLEQGAIAVDARARRAAGSEQ